MLKIKVLFLGSKRLGLRVLQEIHSLAPESLCGAVTIDDRDDVRSEWNEIHQYAQEKSILLKVAQNGREADEIISEFAPDLCLVAGWYWLIRSEILDSVPRGFIGIHYSLLPKYRGSSPLVWAIINGDPIAGFSVFSFTPGMDDGPVWATGQVDVGETDAIGDVLDKLEGEVLEVLRNSYVKILNEEIVPVEQDHSELTYCAQRLPQDGLIDWNQPATAVHNFIRAQSEPYPGAFTWHEGQKLMIWKARLEPAAYYGTPGQVGRVGNGEVHVVCGNSQAIILEEVEVSGDGNNRCAASEVIRSIKTRLR